MPESYFYKAQPVALRELAASVAQLDRCIVDIRGTMTQTRAVITETRELLALMDAQEVVAARARRLRWPR